MIQHPNHDWAAEHALDAILGEHGVDAPAVSAAGWLKTLLDEIEGSPEILEILGRDDPDSRFEMLRECREMSNGLMTAILLMVPPDEANLGYQACVALEAQLRGALIDDGDEIEIYRDDFGEGNGYCLSHHLAAGGSEHYFFNEDGAPRRYSLAPIPRARPSRRAFCV